MDCPSILLHCVLSILNVTDRKCLKHKSERIKDFCKLSKHNDGPSQEVSPKLKGRGVSSKALRELSCPMGGDSDVVLYRKETGSFVALLVAPGTHFCRP